MTAKTPTTHVIAVPATRVAATRAVVEAARPLLRKLDSVKGIRRTAWDVEAESLRRALADLDALK